MRDCVACGKPVYVLGLCFDCYVKAATPNAIRKGKVLPDVKCDVPQGSGSPQKAARSARL